MEYLFGLWLPGKPVTKKNSGNIVYVGKKCPTCRRGNHPLIMPSKAFQAYEKASLKALETIKQNSSLEIMLPLKEDLSIRCIYDLPKNKDGSIPKVLPDLTNLLEATDDILVKAKYIADDNCNVIISHDGSRVRFIDSEQEVGAYIEFYRVGEGDK